MNGTEEEFVPEDEAEAGPELIKRLREKLKKAVEEKQEYLEGWQRSRADFANFKREEAASHGDKEERTKAQVLEELIPILDTFELSMRHGAGKEMQMVHKQLLDALKRLGVEQFGAPGEVFDPYKFEALEEVPAEDEQQDHTVASVQRMGYAIGQRVVRPAQVSVYIYKK